MSAFGVRAPAMVAALILSALFPATSLSQDGMPTVPVPRAKPAYVPVTTPLPRTKPVTAPAPAPEASRPVAPAEPEPIPLPTEAQVEAGMLACGEACGEILFKAIDGCLWVQSQNPRPIVMQARIDGRLREMRLEGASYEKSSARPPEGAGAYHTRQKDPFQSSSPGIPVYRVRMGDKASCVKDRGQLSGLVAIFGG